MDTFFTTNLIVDFKINRLVEKRLIASHYDLSVDLDIDPEYTAEEQTKRIANIKFWIDNILNNCIAFSIYNTINTELLAEIENFVMFCPEEPNDYLLLMLIVSKLNAIGSDVVTITHASINSDTNQGFGNTVTGNPISLLPDPADWMGEIRYFDQAWWNRSDGSMLDVAVDEGDDPEVKPDILIELDPAAVKIETDTSPVAADDDKPSAEIIRLKFKPRIVTNNDETEE